MEGCVWGLLQHRPTLKLVNITPFSWEPSARHRAEPSHTNIWLPKIPTWTENPTKPVRVLASANILHVPLMDYHSMAMVKGFIHTSHTEREFILSTFRLDQAEQNLLGLLHGQNKVTPRKWKNPESWTTKSTIPCTLCTQQFQILPPSSWLKMYISKEHTQAQDWRRALYQQGCRCLSLLIHKSSAEEN